MAKKVSYDNLPAAVGKILEILTAEGSDHTAPAALSELLQRVVLLERKLDHLEKTLSPNRPVMDKHSVLKVLKIRPKMLHELEMSGILPSHTEGRRTLFYESDVVNFYMTQPAWKGAVETKPVPEKFSPESAPSTSAAEGGAEGRQRIDIKAASGILARSTAAVYQLIQGKSVPHYKDGRKVYFYTDELREWARTHPPRSRR